MTPVQKARARRVQAEPAPDRASVLAKVRATKRTMGAESRAQAARAIAGTPGGAAEARGAGHVVATEEAGTTLTWMADAYLIDHCRSTGVLTDRQCDAAEELARARGMFLPRPWAKGDRQDMADDDAREAAERRYGELLLTAPHACRSPMATLAMGEWPVVPGMPQVLRIGLDALADHLRIAA